MEKLSSAQSMALLAHEIGHMRLGHIRGFAILNFLARWTFVGEGFLACWLGNPIDLEKASDAFAVCWLEQNVGTRQDLLELLRILQKQEILGSLEAMWSTRAVAIFRASESTILRVQLQSLVGRGHLERMHLLCRAFYFFYFGGWQANYRYLTYDKRIQFITEFNA
jgi:hypothetical protein